MADLTGGQSIGHYRVVDKLGEGGMGVVYRARDERLDRDVAIKVLHEEVAEDPERLRRFEREARTAGSLNHPNILTVHELGSHHGSPFIAAELLEGDSLRAVVARGRLTPRTAVEYAIQIAHGLAKAHEKGITHRDLKPENLFLTSYGRIKILDFGLAKLKRDEGATGAASEAPTGTLTTRPGTVIGTAAYMAPEQVLGRPTDHRCDIFSLGVVLYEMLSGDRPFRGKNVTETSAAILSHDPATLETVVPAVPPPLADLVQRCLEKRPEDRFSAAHDLGLALEAYTGSVQPARRKPSKRLALGLGLAAVAAVMTIVTLVGPKLREQTTATTASPGIRSIAVLPLVNISGDPGQEYFADGMHEALITDLSKIASLRVISRTSAMRFKGTARPLPEIAEELGVDALVEGSVLRVGGRVRITAQLIDGRSDDHLWADSFDRDLEDVLAVLSDVARSIATEIEGVLTPEQQRLLARQRRTAPEVLDLYLQAQHQFNTMTRAGFEEALRLNTRALEFDPNFAPAHAGIAACYAIFGLFGYAPVSEVAAKAEGAAQRSIELDPTLAIAHGALAHVKVWLEWDWPAAEAAFEKALDLDPGHAMTRHGYADLLTALGKPEEGLRQIELGRRYDPLSRLANIVYVKHLALNRHYPETLEEIERLRDRFEDSRCSHWGWEFAALWHPGRHEEALAVVRECWADQDAAIAAAIDEGSRLEGPEGAMAAIARELARRVAEGPEEATDVARYLAKAGDVEGTLVWLERAVEEHVPMTMHVIAHPDIDCVRDHPRFRDLLRRMNLPPEAVEFWARRLAPGQRF